MFKPDPIDRLTESLCIGGKAYQIYTRADGMKYILEDGEIMFINGCYVFDNAHCPNYVIRALKTYLNANAKQEQLEFQL